MPNVTRRASRTGRPRAVASLLANAALLAVASVAHADEPAPEPSAADAVPDDLADLVLATGRVPVQKAEGDLLRLQVRGEYQLRYQQMRDFALEASPRAQAATPGLTSDTLGQNKFLSQWLRLTPRFQIRDRFEIVGQIDLVTGLVLGERAHDTSADRTPRDANNGFGNTRPRWLYAHAQTALGLFRIGQQPVHFGMGILTNDGDHVPLFGDYRYGAISERALFATRPGGAESPFVVVAAADLVFQDAQVQLIRGDVAWQGVVAAFYERGAGQLGFYGVYRDQTKDRTTSSSGTAYSDHRRVLSLSLAGKLATKVPGEDAFVFVAGEIACNIGSNALMRTPAGTPAVAEQAVRSYGGALQAGVVHRAYSASSDAVAKDPKAYGDVVGQIEIGYASGDGNPYDNVESRFVMDPNHKVGLVLFDEVLRFQTARSATSLQDGRTRDAVRVTPSAYGIATDGGVAGAHYVNPTAIVRPFRWLDLKGGVLLAHATSDVVSTYRAATTGAYANDRGGTPSRRDLGIELDVGTEARAQLDYGMVASVGVQAGVLFPGGAFADEAGALLRPPFVVVGRGALQF